MLPFNASANNLSENLVKFISLTLGKDSNII